MPQPHAPDHTVRAPDDTAATPIEEPLLSTLPIRRGFSHQPTPEHRSSDTRPRQWLRRISKSFLPVSLKQRGHHAVQGNAPGRFLNRSPGSRRARNHTRGQSVGVHFDRQPHPLYLGKEIGKMWVEGRFTTGDHNPVDKRLSLGQVA